MRKVKYLAGSVALAMAVSVAAVAQADVLSQKVEWQPNPSPAKQAKKKPRGGVGLGVRVESDYDNIDPGGPPGGPSSHPELAIIHFDRDFAFSNGNLPQCSKASIQTAVSPDAARAACPNAEVGSGDAHLNGALGPATGSVVAFNGVPSGGLQTIELYARVGAPLNATQVLTGTLQPSTKSGSGYGKQLVVPIPPIGGGAQVILDFSVNLPKKVVKPGKKKKGKKKKKPATFFISAKCSDKTWNLLGDFTFVDNPGGGVENKVLTGTDTAPCKQKKAKKKKKKKK
jgi:hypothetical protein